MSVKPATAYGLIHRGGSWSRAGSCAVTIRTVWCPVDNRKSDVCYRLCNGYPDCAVLKRWNRR